MRHAWGEAFPEERRMECGSYLNTFRNDIAVRKGLPATEQKNGQAPGQVVAKGLGELFYLEALLSVPFDYLGRFEKRHLIALFHHLGQPVADASLCDLKDAMTSIIHVACRHKEKKLVSSACLATNSAADVEHIKTSIEFARTWINGWAARPQRSDPLRYHHILALDYLACMFLTTYRPESEDSARAKQVLEKVTRKEPGDTYRSVWLALEAKFVNWLRLGKPAHAFFTDKQTDMSWSVSDNA
jgi:hypothetical protein